MESNYFADNTYNMLLGILEELDEEGGTQYATEFAAFFTHEKDYYVVTDLTGYTSWVNALLGGSDPDSDWFAWDGSVQIKSTQWGGQG